MGFVGSVAAVAGIAVGGLCGLVGVGYLQTYWRVRGSDPTDTGTIREAGRQVELAGTVAAHEAVPESPFTRTESPVHEWKVYEERPGKSESGAVTLDFEEQTQPFILEDGTGEVLIDTGGVQMEFPESDTIVVDPDESPPPAISEYIDGRAGLSRDHDYTRHYRESRLDIGDDVHVFGPVREAVSSFDHPAGVDAVVGVEDPDERSIKLGEDDLGTILKKVRSGDSRFVVSRGSEGEAERGLLKSGLLWLVFGLLFAAFCLAALLLG